MKNIVFDLGGVVFMRDPKKCTEDFIRFFSFVRAEQMPWFWNEYDRGTRSLEEVKGDLCELNNCDRKKVDEYLQLAIDKQEVIAPTEALIHDLKAAGYRLYVLSNMSKEYIEFLRKLPVFEYFDEQIVSCEVHLGKPNLKFYQHLLDHCNLNPDETIFIDDRKDNVEAGAELGITPFHFDRRNPERACDELRKVIYNK